MQVALFESQSMAITLILLLAFLATIDAAILSNGVVVPTFAKVCRRSQPDINDCLRKSIQTLCEKVTKVGVKEINLPTLDPWKIKEFSFVFGGNRNFQLRVTVRDFNTTGFSKMQIRGVRSKFDDPKKHILDVDIFNDNVFVEGDYFIDGRVYGAVYNDYGKFDTNIYNVGGTVKMSGPLVEKDGNKYFRIDHSLFRPYIGDMKIRAETGNSRNAQIMKLIVIFLNQFWKPIHQETLAVSEGHLDRLWTPMINMAFMKIPFDQLIPK